MRKTVFARHIRWNVAGLCLAFGFGASASGAQGVAPTRAASQYVQPAAQAPAPLYQGSPFTPRPIAPPRPVLQRPALGAPQASGQAATPACDCYYPQGYCPFPSGRCSLPQGNCVAPVPSPQGIAPSPQGY